MTDKIENGALITLNLDATTNQLVLQIGTSDNPVEFTLILPERAASDLILGLQAGLDQLRALINQEDLKQ